MHPPKYQRALCLGDEFLNDLTKVRIKIKTTKLPTASLKDLKISSDKGSSWVPPRNWKKTGAVVSLHFVDTGQVMKLAPQSRIPDRQTA